MDVKLRETSEKHRAKLLELTSLVRDASKKGEGDEETDAKVIEEIIGSYKEKELEMMVILHPFTIKTAYKATHLISTALITL